MLTQVGQCIERLPVMPLPLVLLPGGIQRLKIYEPKSISMVKSAIKGRGFVVSTVTPDAPYHSSPWGVWVKVIDFNLTKDNILLIDIQGISMVEFTDLTREDSGALSTNSTLCKLWGYREMGPDISLLVEHLRDIFKQNSSLNKLYKKTHFYDVNWVFSRYIELLPLSLSDKEKFIFDYSFDQIEGFLHTLVQGPIRHH
ncbi:hypothetical protein HQQ94_13685 [Shewanella sp. VB17]|uniref:LON peptidase substrate-binding domain-containing protein n=1 Tax=Shewanella sp. VB17 TaxID=2739432 RepID=UPI001566132F|nr:LON peptidase substrate-binding domain-containing protein [Shewanella sp. VB17]NRD74268.1 hypothetical protein [Shewanella sp. VB17]